MKRNFLKVVLSVLIIFQVILVIPVNAQETTLHDQETILQDDESTQAIISNYEDFNQRFEDLINMAYDYLDRDYYTEAVVQVVTEHVEILKDELKENAFDADGKKELLIGLTEEVEYIILMTNTLDEFKLKINKIEVLYEFMDEEEKEVFNFLKQTVTEGHNDIDNYVAAFEVYEFFIQSLNENPNIINPVNTVKNQLEDLTEKITIIVENFSGVLKMSSLTMIPLIDDALDSSTMKLEEKEKIYDKAVSRYMDDLNLIKFYLKDLVRNINQGLHIKAIDDEDILRITREINIQLDDISFETDISEIAELHFEIYTYSFNVESIVNFYSNYEELLLDFKKYAEIYPDKGALKAYDLLESLNNSPSNVEHVYTVLMQVFELTEQYFEDLYELKQKHEKINEVVITAKKSSFFKKYEDKFESLIIFYKDTNDNETIDYSFQEFNDMYKSALELEKDFQKDNDLVDKYMNLFESLSNLNVPKEFYTLNNIKNSTLAENNIVIEKLNNKSPVKYKEFIWLLEEMQDKYNQLNIFNSLDMKSFLKSYRELESSLCIESREEFLFIEKEIKNTNTFDEIKYENLLSRMLTSNTQCTESYQNTYDKLIDKKDIVKKLMDDVEFDKNISGFIDYIERSIHKEKLSEIEIKEIIDQLDYLINHLINQAVDSLEEISALLSSVKEYKQYNQKEINDLLNLSDEVILKLRYFNKDTDIKNSLQLINEAHASLQVLNDNMQEVFEAVKYYKYIELINDDSLSDYLEKIAKIYNDNPYTLSETVEIIEKSGDVLKPKINLFTEIEMIINEKKEEVSNQLNTIYTVESQSLITQFDQAVSKWPEVSEILDDPKAVANTYHEIIELSNKIMIKAEKKQYIDEKIEKFIIDFSQINSLSDFTNLMDELEDYKKTAMSLYTRTYKQPITDQELQDFLSKLNHLDLKKQRFIDLKAPQIHQDLNLLSEDTGLCDLHREEIETLKNSFLKLTDFNEEIADKYIKKAKEIVDSCDHSVQNNDSIKKEEVVNIHEDKDIVQQETLPEIKNESNAKHDSEFVNTATSQSYQFFMILILLSLYSMFKSIVYYKRNTSSNL